MAYATVRKGSPSKLHFSEDFLYAGVHTRNRVCKACGLQIVNMLGHDQRKLTIDMHKPKLWVDGTGLHTETGKHSLQFDGEGTGGHLPIQCPVCHNGALLCLG